MQPRATADTLEDLQRRFSPSPEESAPTRFRGVTLPTGPDASIRVVHVPGDNFACFLLAAMSPAQLEHYEYEQVPTSEKPAGVRRSYGSKAAMLRAHRALMARNMVITLAQRELLPRESAQQLIRLVQSYAPASAMYEVLEGALHKDLDAVFTAESISEVLHSGNPGANPLLYESIFDMEGRVVLMVNRIVERDVRIDGRPPCTRYEVAASSRTFFPGPSPLRAAAMGAALNATATVVLGSNIVIAHDSEGVLRSKAEKYGLSADEVRAALSASRSASRVPVGHYDRLEIGRDSPVWSAIAIAVGHGGDSAMTIQTLPRSSGVVADLSGPLEADLESSFKGLILCALERRNERRPDTHSLLAIMRVLAGNTGTSVRHARASSEYMHGGVPPVTETVQRMHRLEDDFLDLRISREDLLRRVESYVDAVDAANRLSEAWIRATIGRDPERAAEVVRSTACIVSVGRKVLPAKVLESIARVRRVAVRMLPREVVADVLREAHESGKAHLARVVEAFGRGTQTAVLEVVLDLEVAHGIARSV